MAEFYYFGSRNYLTTFAACEVLCEEMCERQMFAEARELSRRLYLGEYDGIPFPLVFRQVDGKRFRDVLDNRSVCNYLISDRMKKVLENNGLTGWKCYPIELYDKKGCRVEGYSGFSVTGRIELDYDTSGIFVSGSWDGSDFNSGGGVPIVTERAMKVMKAAKIDAVDYRPISEMKYEKSHFRQESRMQENPVDRLYQDRLVHVNAGKLFKDGMKYYDRRLYSKAFPLLKQAAEAGHKEAQWRLGAMYYYGDGVAQDYACAAEWYRKAADQGETFAQFDIGVMYKNGIGVKQDNSEALSWFRKAEKLDYRAREAARQLTNEMDLDHPDC